MAESDVRSEQIHNEEEQEGMSQEQRLKYLDFVHVAAIHSLICLSKLYNFAKENSGPLLPGVQTAEESIKAVVGPVYDKFHNLPFDTLKFVDRKVYAQATRRRNGIEITPGIQSLINQISS